MNTQRLQMHHRTSAVAIRTTTAPGGFSPLHIPWAHPYNNYFLHGKALPRIHQLLYFLFQLIK